MKLPLRDMLRWTGENWPIRAVSLILLVVLIVGLCPPVWAESQAAADWPEECAEGDLGSQRILICVPETWNGVLLIYAHGYVAPQLPLDLPREELLRFTLPDGRTIVDVLLELGYAFATSSYSKNGYAIEQAEQDLNALVAYFKTLVPPGLPDKVLLGGASEGGLVTVKQLEKHPDTYHGGLAMCGPIGGAPYQVQHMGDFRVVYDYFYPDVFDFGAVSIPADAYLHWDDIYVPLITEAVRSSWSRTWQLYNVTRVARDPLNPWDSAVDSALGVLWYNIWATNDLIATAGGVPYDNQSVRYRGSFNDRALNARVERVSGDPAAMAYMLAHYQPTAQLQGPVVTLHTTWDPVVPYKHEAIYAGLASGAGTRNRLTVLPVLRYGHCEFTAFEVLGAFALLVLQTTGEPDPGLDIYVPSLPEPLPADNDVE